MIFIVPFQTSPNLNKTYDIRVEANQQRERTQEEKENEKHFKKMEAVRREKRDRYEQAVFKKLENIDTE